MTQASLNEDAKKKKVPSKCILHPFSNLKLSQANTYIYIYTHIYIYVFFFRYVIHRIIIFLSQCTWLGIYSILAILGFGTHDGERMQWTDDEVWWTFYRITCALTREYIKWDISGFSYWKVNQNLFQNHLHDSQWDGQVLSLPQNQSRLLLWDLILFSYFTLFSLWIHLKMD